MDSARLRWRFFSHSQDPQFDPGNKSSNLVERLRTGANVLVKLIYVFEVILSARGVVHIVRFSRKSRILSSI